MDHNITQLLRNRPITPLWIVALFISLTEIAIVAALVFTASHIQLTLTVFAIAFPVVNLFFFYLVLWYRPYVLYPPTEFSGIDVGQYVSAMNRRAVSGDELFQNIQEAVRVALCDEEIVSGLVVSMDKELTFGPAGVNKVLKDVAESASEKVKMSAFLVLDLSVFGRGFASDALFPYLSGQSVADFLDSVYSLIETEVDPFTYNLSWVLSDASSGEPFRQVGTLWSMKKHNSLRDDRTLAEVGIHAGMSLKVLRLSSF